MLPPEYSKVLVRLQDQALRRDCKDEVDTIKRIHQEFRRRKTTIRRNKARINEEETTENTTGL